MNFNGFDFDDNTKMLLSELDGGGRLPHALIIESPDPQKAAKLAEYISMYAVCSGDDCPCGTCKNCINAQKRAHPDITYLELLPKKTVYTIEQMREITKDAYIKPNEARAKVYIFERADELFQTLVHKARAMIRGLEVATEARIETERMVYYPCVTNPRPMVEQLYTVLDSMDDAVLVEPAMAAEDFAEYQREVPGVFFFLGIEGGKGGAPLHAQNFDFDEEALLYGVEIFKRLLLQ